MKWRTPFLICSLLSLNHSVFGETLSQAIQQALDSNPELLIVEKNKLASDQGIKQARAGYFPKIDLNAGYGVERSNSSSTTFKWVHRKRREAGLTVRQLLFDGFATGSELKRQRARAEAEAYRVWGASEDIGLAVADGYLNVLRSKEIVASAEQNVSAHEHAYAMVEKLRDSGLGSDADATQAFSRLALVKANLLSAESVAQDAIAAYAKLVGSEPKTLTPPSPVPEISDLPNTHEAAVSVALEHHPILKSAEVDIEEARGQHEVALSSMYPKLDIVLNGNRNHDLNGVKGRDYDASAMLQMQYNLFRGGQDSAKQRETAIRVQEAIEVKNRTQRQVIEKMRFSWNAFKIAEARLRHLKEHKKAADQTREAYKKQFKLGKRTFLDLLNSENEFFIAQNNYINGYYDLIDAKYRILNAQGKLLAFFDLALPATAVVTESILR